MSWQEPFKERERAHEEHFFQQRETIERRKAKAWRGMRGAMTFPWAMSIPADSVVVPLRL